MQKIAIIGAGAVGCGLGFLLNRAGREVTLIGRADQVEGLRTKGLWVEGDTGEHQVKIPAAENLDFKPDLALLAVKTQDVVGALRENLPVRLAARVAAARVDRMKTIWPLLGSTLQSLRRKRPTEIDYLNGEVVELGKKTGTPTPLNAKIVELVHQVEQTGTFFNLDEVRRKFLFRERVAS